MGAAARRRLVLDRWPLGLSAGVIAIYPALAGDARVGEHQPERRRVRVAFRAHLRERWVTDRNNRITAGVFIAGSMSLRSDVC